MTAGELTRSQHSLGYHDINSVLYWFMFLCQQLERITENRVNSPQEALPPHLITWLVSMIQNCINETTQALAEVKRLHAQNDIAKPEQGIGGNALTCGQLRTIDNWIVHAIRLLDMATNLWKQNQDEFLDVLVEFSSFKSSWDHHGPNRPMAVERRLGRYREELIELIRDMFRKLERLSEFKPRVNNLFIRMKEQFQTLNIQCYERTEDIPYFFHRQTLRGEGGSGRVSHASHKTSGQEVAIKEFRSDVSEVKIIREILVLGRCPHENIVKLVEAYRDGKDGPLYLVMFPYAPFTLLAFLDCNDKTKNACCPWFSIGSSASNKIMYRIMYGLANGMDCFHSLSIKHKDLKPANILLHREDTEYIKPYITDFGEGKVYWEGVPTDYTGGTYEYLAPEQHDHRASTFKSDIWQLGCCFAQLLVTSIGGERFWLRLQQAYKYDGPNCSCSVAGEYVPFERVLETLCQEGDSKQIAVYEITKRMLSLDPSCRPDSKTIKNDLAELL